MATRDDVIVDFSETPRIIEVASPSVEMTMQDLVDTSRKIEDAFALGLTFDELIKASGKEDLGGGISVGITTDLQNAQLSFEPRSTPAVIGTVTTGSGTPISSVLGPVYNFVDTGGADFVAAGIQRGSLVINFTDNSVADVIEVVSSTELRTRVLVNGIDNEWDIGDVYHVFNIIQCNATGGNLVAVDESDIRISPVFPSAFTQVIRTASSSATLQEQADIQYASYGGGVTIDVNSGNSGTVFPVGTQREPVNNFGDAYTILIDRGFDTFFIKGDIYINDPVTVPYLFKGQAASVSEITLDTIPDFGNARFQDATIIGKLDKNAELTNCTLSNLTLFNGKINSCILSGTISLGQLINGIIVDSFSDIGGCTIDMGVSGQALELLNFNGDVILTNKTGIDVINVGLGSGQITIDNTVTNGMIRLFGVGKWTNETTYSGGATVVNELIASADTQLVTFNDRITVDVINGISGVAYPTGTPRSPVDNLTDAATLAAARGIKNIFAIGDLTIGNESDWTGFNFQGEGSTRSTLNFLVSGTTTNIGISDAEVIGFITGADIEVKDSIVNALILHSGQFTNCGLQGTTTLTSTNTDVMRFVDCYGAGDPAITQPRVDMGGDGPLVTMARYAGGMTFLNKTGSKALGVIMQGGPLTLDPTVISGLVIAGGLAEFTDNSAGATVIDITIGSNQSIIDTLNTNIYDGVAFSDVMKNLLSMATGRIVESATGVFDFYNQDSTTIAFTLTKSGNERNRSSALEFYWLDGNPWTPIGEPGTRFTEL